MKQSPRSLTFIALIVAIVIMPGILWYLGKTNYPFLDSKVFFVTSLGQLTALLGITLYALAIIFSKRLPFLYKMYGNIQKAYRLHHWIGTLAFILLLAHPLLSVFKLLDSSPRIAAEMFIPGLSWQTTWGVLALGLMIISGIAIYLFNVFGKSWKTFHTIIEWAFIPALIHFLIVSSDVTTNKPLRVYIGGISLLAVFSMIYGLIIKIKN